MRFVRFLDRDHPQLGLLEGDAVRPVPGADDLLPLLAVAGGLADGAAAAAGAPPRPLDGLELLAPIATPPTIRDFYAFEQHAAAGRRARGLELDPTWYELPVFYFSNPYAVRGPGPVPVPPRCTRFDFEVEVAAVIGTAGRDVAEADAEALIAGYTLLNDWSARDLQAREMKLNLGPAKGKDSVTGLGPVFVTADELEPYRKGKAFDLAMTATVNGEPYSAGNWSDIHWSFAEMIAYASRGTEVRPGDVLGSGTCATGCILELSLTHGEDRYPWLRPGDEVVTAVEQLGTHRSTVVAS
jgi:2-keto-4-pentenoate hydratase/2-oxohepta-3-ene-1,7-dioic acid hydratase in catechol pathway